MAKIRDERVIESLAKCVADCHRCIQACLASPDLDRLARCIKLNMDCAEMCELTARFIARDSENTFQVRDECEEICLYCAQECEKHAYIEHCRICAEACRECAKTCRVL